MSRARHAAPGVTLGGLGRSARRGRGRVHDPAYHDDPRVARPALDRCGPKPSAGAASIMLCVLAGMATTRRWKARHPISRADDGSLTQRAPVAELKGASADARWCRAAQEGFASSPARPAPSPRPWPTGSQARAPRWSASTGANTVSVHTRGQPISPRRIRCVSCSPASRAISAELRSLPCSSATSALCQATVDDRLDDTSS